MSKIGNAIHEIHHMDLIAERDQWVNAIHPLIKFVITVVYIAVVVSFLNMIFWDLRGWWCILWQVLFWRICPLRIP